MKMGNRKRKALDKLGVNAQNKPRVTTEPSNRQERRALQRVLRQQASKVRK
jgi:hypothetical protein